ncbi:MAG TPA: mycofactocin precursor MftA [Acidimicrobiales bacterium]
MTAAPAGPTADPGRIADRAARSGAGTEPSGGLAGPDVDADSLVLVDELIEEVSIDGMCGVY